MNLPKLLMQLVLGRRLPIREGQLSLKGLGASVVIRRDPYGIPHIEAESDSDAAFGLGFCHGQDRSFQLETLLRLGRGTLAALVGKAAVPVDRLSRRIGFFRAAQQQLRCTSSVVQDLLASYTKGVNAAHEQGSTKVAHEFTLLGSKPTPWQPADVLAYLKLQSFLLPSNWDVELARLRILLLDGPEVLRDLEPGVADWLPTILPEKPAQTLDALSSLEADLALFRLAAATGGGSNNWVISGSRTASGLPLLANDPHLPATVPAAWYLASIRTPDGLVAGASFAGCPVFPTGHNGRACWGITAGLTDNTDLFQETLSDDGRSVREADGNYQPCEVISEVISIKNGQDLVEEVLLTPRGPIITPFLSSEFPALALSAIWLKPLPIRGFLDSAKATDFESFRSAFREWPALPLNIVYADSSGETGWQLVGQLPQRQGGHGLLPMPADTPGVGWKPDLIPFEQMPHVKNPPQGYLATANQHPMALSAPFLGFDFCDGYRAQAIHQLLQLKGNGWTAEDCLQMQLDVQCVPWQELKPLIGQLQPADPAARLGLELLQSWDGQLSANSGIATVYTLAIAELVRRVVKGRAPNSWRVALGETGTGPFSHSLFGERRHSYLIRLFKKPPGWLERPLLEEFHHCLGQVIRQLRQERGPSPEWWTWGDVRPLRVQHPLLGSHWLLGRIFNLPAIPFQGDAHTICQSGQRILEPLAAPHMIANLRAVYDTADFRNSRFSLAGGQSGNPFSPHYDDLFPLWQDGRGVAIPYTQDEDLKSAVSTLRLNPSQ